MKFTPEQKEIALRVIEDYDPEHRYFPYRSDFIEILEALLAALPKPEPVGMFYYDGDGKWIQSTKELPCKEPLQPLYAYPPTTLAIAEKPDPVAWLRNDLNDVVLVKWAKNQPIHVQEYWNGMIPLYTSPPATSELESTIHHAKQMEALDKLKIEELETANTKLKQDLLTSYGESEELSGQNTTLLVAIEALKESLHYERDLYLEAGSELRESSFEALFLSPSAELLEARDRKRDAALLRVVLANADWSPNQLVYANGYIDDLANQRESGEWIPELGE